MKKLLLVLVTLLPIFSSAQILDAYNFTNCDTIGFEDTTHVFIEFDTSSTNIWQIGNPNKAVFTAALGGNKALVTDTLNTYPSSNISSFIFSLKDQIWNNNCSMSNGWSLIFIHSMNTDSLSGGYIEYSDDSLNWHNVFDIMNVGDGVLGIFKVGDFSTPPVNIEQFTPKLLFNGELGFSGNFVSDTFYIYQNYFPVKNTYIKPWIRFTFISDSNSISHDGWMIDQLVFGTYDVVGSVSENLSRNISLYPNPALDKLSVDIDAEKFKPVSYRITNTTGQLMADEKFTNRHINITTLPAGAYIITLTDAKGNSGAKTFYKQ